ncbi:hypothetical protein BDN70DRAFT_978498 [Pholiota conissans]|uniref:Uncharacterized protein n=1 Tax=Pholiota conissans TaxID=109636 RepID=A0A9P6CUJ6_9AGAR|nr:hypothetical protein BDN70DRAFT_978498 [Pholiota conissans]
MFLFSNKEQKLPQLHVLSLTRPESHLHYHDRRNLYFDATSRQAALNLHPTSINDLSLTRIMLISVANFDWSNLSRLTMTAIPRSDCFQALRMAPRLAHCAFMSVPAEYSENVRTFPIPQAILVHTNIQYFSIHDIGPRRDLTIFRALSCPSLKTLVLRIEDAPPEISLVIQFLERSRCSLEKLSLHSELALFESNITSLYTARSLMKLQHLHITVEDLELESTWEREPISCNIFVHLAIFSTSGGQKQPLYFPCLRSLHLNISSFGGNWAMVADIFGTRTTHNAIERHRHALESLVLTLSPDLLHPTIDEESLQNVLWLRDSENVKLTIHDGREDMIAHAVEKYELESRW